MSNERGFNLVVPGSSPGDAPGAAPSPPPDPKGPGASQPESFMAFFAPHKDGGFTVRLYRGHDNRTEWPHEVKSFAEGEAWLKERVPGREMVPLKPTPPEVPRVVPTPP